MRLINSSSNIYLWQFIIILKYFSNFATPNKPYMDKTIARNIKKLRETARYTQNEVANALGVSRSAYSNYESGDREIPYDVIENASDFFGCDMTELFEENHNVDALILVSAFRIDNITPDDSGEIMRFKDIVKSYLKMEAIEIK